MQHHVDSYICEWKDAVEDEHKRKRFTHFVNSDARDETIQFVDEVWATRACALALSLNKSIKSTYYVQ